MVTVQSGMPIAVTQATNNNAFAGFGDVQDAFSSLLAGNFKNTKYKWYGFVRLDGIYDFKPMGSTDSFVTSSIPIPQGKGTNAIGTALVERAPVVVNGPEHYLTANHFLTCSAAPILDPHGEMAGVLDVTGDYRGFNQHTMALVKMSVQMIENHLLATAFPEAVGVRIQSRPEFLGTLCEGILAFDAEGTCIAANRSACFQLGRPLDQLRKYRFESLFSQPLRTVVDHALVRDA